VDAIGPRIGEKIVDPFCGTGGFLIYAFEVVSEKIRLNDFSKAERERWKEELSNRSLYGTDWKERTSIACKMNMTVHGDGSSGIFLHHGLTDVPNVIEESKFDICITNPPFGSFENDPAILRAYEMTLGRNSQDRVVLAIERAIRLVQPGSGRIGIVVIDGILNNKSGKPVREYIKRNVRVLGVVSLAKETFEGYGARAKTSVLFLERKESPDDGEQGPVFFGVAANTGYAPNGNAVPGNELPDLLVAYREHLRGNSPDLSNVRVAQPGDRLDAEFYVPQAVQTTADLGVLYNTASTTLADLFSQYAALQGMVHNALAAAEFVPVELRDVLSEVRSPVTLQDEVNYALLGVRWWGGGAFIREEKLGKEIKASTAFAVAPNLIIYNRLFAFRGSFALLTEEHKGAVASGEFPMFDVKDDVNLNGLDPLLLKKYIVYCLNSPRYLTVVERLSTGSTKTSRNRLLQDTFLGITVAVPADASRLAVFVNLFDALAALSARQLQLSEELEQFRRGATLLVPPVP
jgi:type I restriction enzyme M protein